MISLPSLDAHAHIRADLEAREVATLDGVVLAATRSLDEADVALARDDERVVWGVGAHPGLARAHKSFSRSRFEALIQRTPLVSEVGLDGGSRVSPVIQRETFETILRSLQHMPRIVSVHSYAATADVLDAIERCAGRGIVLHWWLGDNNETQRALELGCYFSVNSSPRSLTLLNSVPASRILPETDHPYGDRRGRSAARPGNVLDVEKRLAGLSGASMPSVRLRIWQNLLEIATATKTVGLLPRAVRRQLAAL